MQSDNGFEKVSTAVPTVETISTKICQMAQKKGDKGGLKRTAQKCGASKSGGAGRHSDFAEVLSGNGTSLSFPKFCWVIVGPIGCRPYCEPMTNKEPHFGYLSTATHISGGDAHPRVMCIQG